jgi:hypothetical protein
MTEGQWEAAWRLGGGVGYSEGVRRAVDLYGRVVTEGVSRVRGGEAAGVVSAGRGESGWERAAELVVSGVRAADEGGGGGEAADEEGGREGDAWGD